MMEKSPDFGSGLSHSGSSWSPNASRGLFPCSRMHDWNRPTQQLAETPYGGFWTEVQACLTLEPVLSPLHQVP